MTRAFRLVAQHLALGAMLVVLALPPLHATAQEQPRVGIVRGTGHLDAVGGAAFSPDGTRLVSVDEGGAMKLWDVATGRLLQSFQGERGYGVLLAFTPDGTRVLSADSREMKVWDTATGQHIKTLKDFPISVNSIAVSPDSKSVLVGTSSGTVQLRDLESGRTLGIFRHAGGFAVDTAVAFSPDGARVLTAGRGDKLIKVWETASGGFVRAFGDSSDRTRGARLAVSPDGTRAAVVGDGFGGFDGALTVWDLATGTRVQTLEGRGDWRAIEVVTFSRDGTRVAVGGLGWVRVWDAKSGRLLHAFGEDSERKPTEARMYAISPDGTRAVSGGWTLTLWDVAARQPVHEFVGLAHPVVALAVSPDGDRLLTGDVARTLRMWNVATGMPMKEGRIERDAYAISEPRIAAVAYGRDRATAIVRSGLGLQLWDAGNGQKLQSTDGYADDRGPVAISPDGASVASGGEILARSDRPISVWDASTGKRVRSFPGHVESLRALAFSPDGTRIASGGSNGEVKLWDMATRRLVRTFEAKSRPAEGRSSFRETTNAVTAVAFSPDGKLLLSAGHDGTMIYLWDKATGQAVRSWEGQPQVTTLVFSPDGRLAVSGGADPKFQLWEVATGRLVHTFVGHFERISALAFSNDGRRLFSGSLDGTVGVWDAGSGALLATMLPGQGGEWLTVTPEGFFDASSPALARDMLGVVSGFDTFGIDPFIAALHRPDLVREKLEGDPDGKVRDAAAALDFRAGLDKARAARPSSAPPAQAAPQPAALPVRVVPQMGHSSQLRALAYAPDGRFVASGSADNTVKLWDAATGRELRTFAGHSKSIRAVAFSPDTRFLLSGSEDATVKLWDLTTGKQVRSFAGHQDAVLAVAFSPDGRFALSGADAFASLRSDRLGQVKLWEIASGKALRTLNGHAAGVSAVAFSPDGRLALSGGQDKRLKLWDLAAGQEVLSFPQHGSSIEAVAFSPDGRLALSGSDDKTMKLWDVATGKELRSFVHPRGVTSVAFSPDGNFALSGMTYDRLLGRDGSSAPSSFEKMKLWDVRTGAEVRTFVEPGDPIPEASIHGRIIGNETSVALSPDGRFALSNTGRDMLEWDVATGKPVRAYFGRSSRVGFVAFSPDTRLALSAGGGTLHLWDMATGKELRSFGQTWWGTAAAFSPDGRLVLAGAHGDFERRMMDSPSDSHGVAFSPDGRLALSGSGWKLELWDTATGQQVRAFSGSADTKVEDNAVILWDVATGQEVRRLTGHTDWVTSVAFSPNGRLAASGARDRKVRLWEVATGKELRTLDLPGGRGGDFLNLGVAVAFLTDRYVVAGASGGLLVWETDTGKLLGGISDPNGRMATVTFSRDGYRAVSVADDDTIKLWDLTTGKELRSFTGHTSTVDSVAVSPNDRLVLSGSNDGTARIWDGKTGREIARMMTGSEAWVTMTPEGFFSSPQRDTSMLSLVRGLEATTIGQIYQSLFNPDLVREALANDADGNVKRAAEAVNLQKVVDSGPAPGVSIVSPDRGSASATDLVTVAARVSDRGKGIGRIEWRVNGVTAGVGKAPGGPGPDHEVRQTLALDPGENRIEVIAYERRNLLASLPARTIVTYRAPASPAKPQLHILAVGINAYVDKGGAAPEATGFFPPLRLAVADAKAFAAAFRKAGAGLYSKVHVTEALDDQATAAGLDKIVAQMAARISPRDTFVLFAAAHGTSRDGRFYLIPQDYQGGADPEALARRAIDQERLQDWVANRIKARRAIILLDTCESGALVSGYTKSRTDVPASEAAVGRLHEATGRPVLTAAASGKPAFEGYRGHGVFTYAAMDALHHGDISGNGVIEVSELVAHVQDRVPRLSAELDGRGISMIAVRGSSGDTQSAHFGSTGEDFALVRRLQ